MATDTAPRTPITRVAGRFDSVGLLLGAGGAVLVAGVLVPARETVGTANVALILSGLVVLAALASRLAGIGTAVVAALSFNFFHTRPYRSLRISDGKDIATVCLLVFVGVVVSWFGEWRRSTARSADVVRTSEHQLEAAIATMAAGASADEVFATVRAALVHDLGLADCRFERTALPTMPRLDRHGAIGSRHLRLGAHGFELPDGGVAVDVTSGGVSHGQVVMEPRRGSSSSIVQRRAAVALVDLFALALDREHQRRT